MIITRKDRERNAYARSMFLMILAVMSLSDDEALSKNDLRGWLHLLIGCGLSAYAAYQFLKLSLRGASSGPSVPNKVEA
ncbi:MAG: hypothetical protein ACRCWF_10400 [Beijerinckiaceae bacterium]